jgi:hypothetical protein
MARKRKPVAEARAVHVLPAATSALAATGPDGVLDVGTDGLIGLLEYEPPPLPVPAGLPPGAAAAPAVRVAASALPPVSITYEVARRTWVLLADYSYQYEGHTLTARQGYAYDLSSVPRPLWWLIAPNELSLVAPLFHDLLYEYRGVLPNVSDVNPYRTYTRREVDDLFLHLMEREGVAGWRRYAAYSAVRAAGALYWAT